MSNEPLNYGIEIPVHRDKWRVTVRSDNPADLEYAREKVRDAGLSGRVLVDRYAPGSWQLAPGLDFNTIHVQSPPDAFGRGAVAHSQAGVGGFGVALRQLDPAFHPEAVPDLRDAGGVGQSVLIFAALCTGFGVGVLSRLFSKKV